MEISPGITGLGIDNVCPVLALELEVLLLVLLGLAG